MNKVKNGTVYELRDGLGRLVLSYEKCPEVCERAYYYHDEWYSELMGDERGQWNCPYHYGVTYAAAVLDGKVNCKHFKRKER